MKNKLMNMANKLVMLVIALFANLVAFAQEEGTNVITRTTTTTTNTNTEQWYTSPWAWVIGAAVFILLFAAIIRGGDRRTDA
jgi:glucan phosphoethanolaminetransferase (alkaline phosphatase superfamily)